MSLTDIIKKRADELGLDYVDVKSPDTDLEVINGLPVQPVQKSMTRADAVLTPEESRLYERFSTEEVQKAARHRPINVMDEVQQVILFNNK